MNRDRVRCGNDKHLYYSRGVTIEEMQQASIAAHCWCQSRNAGKDKRDRDRTSDGESVVTASDQRESTKSCPDVRPESGRR